MPSAWARASHCGVRSSSAAAQAASLAAGSGRAASQVARSGRPATGSASVNPSKSAGPAGPDRQRPDQRGAQRQVGRGHVGDRGVAVN